MNNNKHIQFVGHRNNILLYKYHKNLQIHEINKKIKEIKIPKSYALSECVLVCCTSELHLFKYSYERLIAFFSMSW